MYSAVIPLYTHGLFQVLLAIHKQGIHKTQMTQLRKAVYLLAISISFCNHCGLLKKKKKHLVKRQLTISLSPLSSPCFSHGILMHIYTNHPPFCFTKLKASAARSPVLSVMSHFSKPAISKVVLV